MRQPESPQEATGVYTRTLWSLHRHPHGTLRSDPNREIEARIYVFLDGGRSPLVSSLCK
jgi:hypothetical protein